MKKFVFVLAAVFVMSTTAMAATPAEQHLKHWTNRARTNNAVGRLEWKWRLHTVALHQVQKMIECRCLTHTVKPPCRRWGQDIGLGVTARSVWRGFKNSPEHWKNIIDPRFHRGGVAVRRAFGLAWVAMEFCGG